MDDRISRGDDPYGQRQSSRCPSGEAEHDDGGDGGSSVKRLVAAALAILSLVIVGVVAVVSVADMATAAMPPEACDAPGASPAVTGSGPSLAASAAFAAGFRGNDLVMAVAVAGAESSYRPTVRNSIGASGLWQILQSAHQELFDRYNWRDPEQNALMAMSVWSAAGRSWSPWTTFTGGAYRAHLAEARAGRDRSGEGLDPAGCLPTAERRKARRASGPTM